MTLLNIEDIQSNHGVGNRDRFPESMKGEVAKDLWHDTKFAYGMEYGYLLAILDLHDPAYRETEYVRGETER